jgi:hypothetical protein
LVSSPIRSVAPAAAASAISSSYPAQATRPIVASVENPRVSARFAHSTIVGPGAPGTVFGSPIPMSTDWKVSGDVQLPTVVARCAGRRGAWSGEEAERRMKNQAHA